MTKSLSKTVRHEIEDTLEDTITSLRRVADDLSEDTESGVAQAAKTLRQAAHALADKAGPQARELAEKTVEEVKQHPIASTVAALSAAAALIQILSLARKRSA